MTLDPRTPVIVGVGQYNHRTDQIEDALEPAALMEQAVRIAVEDAGLDGPPDADSIRTVYVIGWHYKNSSRQLARRLGIEPSELAESAPGGNSPQSLVNQTALDITSGDVDVAILSGAEAFRTYMRARKDGVRLTWPKGKDDDDPIRIGGEHIDMNLDAEKERGIVMPVQVYPMFETALRAASGRTVEEQQTYISKLWSDLSHVAAGNPNAWVREPKSPEEIATVGPDNRMIGFPYPKLMNSNSAVDMGAALIMCSVEAARRMGVPEDRWVFPHAGTDCHEHNFLSHRDTFTRTPAIEIGGARVMELAGVGIDDVEFLDLYSCFPSAVQLGAQSLGIDPNERQWSRTGGLAFCGGPWNNYPMHAIATMVGELREKPEARGLVWANGGYATKHAFGVYSATPPADGFKYEYPQDEVDALPRRELAVGADAAGPVDIEAYTVMFSRDGQPETAFAACLLHDGRRAWGTSSDPAIAAAMCDGEWVGVTVRLDADGTLRV